MDNCASVLGMIAELVLDLAVGLARATYPVKSNPLGRIPGDVSTGLVCGSSGVTTAMP